MAPLGRMLVRFLVVALAAFGAHVADARMLKVGITLHPYYSFVANIVGDRAEIVPDDPAAWFERYREMIVGYAELAESADVEMLSVGTEDWRPSLIPAARVQPTQSRNTTSRIGMAGPGLAPPPWVPAPPGLGQNASSVARTKQCSIKTC